MAIYKPSQVVGARVRDARHAHGWSQLDLAERMTAAGCRTRRGGPLTQLAISRIERGIEVATVDEVFAFSLVLNVEPAWLLAPVGDEVEVADPEGGAERPVPTYILWSWWRGELPSLFRNDLRSMVIRDERQHPADLVADAVLPGLSGLRRTTSQAIYALSLWPSDEGWAALDLAFGRLERCLTTSREALEAGGRRVNPSHMVAAWWRDAEQFDPQDGGTQ